MLIRVENNYNVTQKEICLRKYTLKMDYEYNNLKICNYVYRNHIS
jgi:hypothetical protein